MDAPVDDNGQATRFLSLLLLLLRQRVVRITTLYTAIANHRNPKEVDLALELRESLSLSLSLFLCANKNNPCETQETTMPMTRHDKNQRRRKRQSLSDSRRQHVYWPIFVLTFLCSLTCRNVTHQVVAQQPEQQEHSSSRMTGTDHGSTTTGAASTAADDTTQIDHSEHYLTEDSVVLITGAAGFIGSELALALHRTYQPRKILLVDALTTTSDHSDDTTLSSSFPKTTQSTRNLSILEYKRQRIFHVLQTLGAVGHFFRTDLRPNVPGFLQVGQVSVLRHILTLHDDITHIVHLASEDSGSSLNDNNRDQRHPPQIIPRTKGQAKAGMMESILEELMFAHTQNDKNNKRKIPHLVYASSHEVYNPHLYMDHNQTEKNPNPPPFREDLPLTTPFTFLGAAKLIDEVLAQAYYEMSLPKENESQQVKSSSAALSSVGLRLFQVYGPWDTPGNVLFDMADQAMIRGTEAIDQYVETLRQTKSRTKTNVLNDGHDFVYIDDAVDAIMSAMQFRSPVGPVIFNVGSGSTTSLMSIANTMKALLQGQSPTEPLVALAEDETSPTVTSFADTQRAETFLGFQARIPLTEGLHKLLAWHYDRAFPYGAGSKGTKNESTETTSDQRNNEHIANRGILSCSKYDDECLLGAPIYPCASECAHESKCTTSFYDDVLLYTRQLTKECEVVMYTVALEDDLSGILSARVEVSTTDIKASSSHVQDNGKSKCNIAFVSDASPLVRRLLSSTSSWTISTSDEELSHGPWTLVPVSVSKFALDSLPLLRLLPKLSPGLFFGGEITKHAIYCDPNVIFEDVSRLLEEFQKRPDSESDSTPVATALLTGLRPGLSYSDPWFDLTTIRRSSQASIQVSAYRAMRIAAIDEMNGDAFAHPIDSSFVVHSLGNDDSRLLRCDMLAEVIQWDVESDESAIQFILGLHDMWSHVIGKNLSEQPWWMESNTEAKERQGQEEDAGVAGLDQDTGAQEAIDVDNDITEGNEDPVLDLDQADETNSIGDTIVGKGLEDEVSVRGGALNDGGDILTANLEVAEGLDPEAAAMDRRRLQETEFAGGVFDGKAEDDDANNEDQEEETAQDWGYVVHNGFGMPEAIQEAVRAVFGGSEKASTADDATDNEVAGDDEQLESDPISPDDRGVPQPGSTAGNLQDGHEYDNDSGEIPSTWLGVLSSTSVRYYARIVPSSHIGAVVISEDDLVS